MKPFSWKGAILHRQQRVDIEIKKMEKVGKGDNVAKLKLQKIKIAKKLADMK